MASKKPFGTITRGTTNPNRLRRVDRYIAALPILRTGEPVVVDLGFGASPITAVELLTRLRKVNSKTQVVGIEIDRERVERGLAVATKQLHFMHGGFETPLPPAFDSATVIRAFNVLRQYDQSEVHDAWELMLSRLQPGGVLVEGTCDEIGRISSWIAITEAGPQTLSIALKLDAIELPSIVAERLPKSLIHHNVPGERIHDFLSALDKFWLTHAALSSFGATQRWIATAQSMKDAGWPITGGKTRWRLGEITVAYDAVRAD